MAQDFLFPLIVHEGDGDVFQGDEAEDDGEAAEDAYDGHVAYEVEAHSGSLWVCFGGTGSLFGCVIWGGGVIV